MPNDRSCPECGRPLPEGALAKVCPACSLQGVLKLISADAQEVQPLPAAVPELSTSTQPILPRFGDYELQELLARGGMGVVYKARQISLNRPVALKRIAAGVLATPAEVRRFHAEAEAIAHLHHPNIVAVHEIGEHEGEHYFSMDYVAGRTLAEVVREGPLPAARAATYVKTVARAVHYAHQQGVIHRDLKPANVIIDEQDQPRITDFGLAKLLTSDFGVRTPDLTTTGQVLGSPNYLPPEQAEPHRRAIGPPSDVYALGAILYHLVTGRPPFQAQSLTTLLRQVIENEPVAPRLLNPNIPRDLETICLKCLQKEPARRYASAQALAEDLECWLRAEPIQARRASHVERVWLWCRRQPVRASLVGALIAVFALGLSGVLWQWRRASRTAQAEFWQRQRAEAGEYAADMHLAQLAVADNNLPLAVSLLDKHRPGEKSELRNPKSETNRKAERRKQNAEIDLRGWEWRYLWQFCRGDESFTLNRFPSAVAAVAVSKDGKVLAAATSDEVVLWDLASRKRLARFGSGTTPVLAFSPTEELLGFCVRTATGQPAVGLWDLRADKLTRTLAREGEIRSFSFSPDGRLLATYDSRGTVQVVDWKSEDTLTNFTASPPRYSAGGHVVFSPDGSRLAIGPGYGRSQLLDLHSGTTTPLQTRPLGVTALAFSPAADLVAVSYSYRNATIVLCDARTGELRGQLTNHSADASGLAFTPDGKKLASAAKDGTIRVWDVASCTELCCLQTPREQPTALAVLPDGRTLVTGGSGGAVSFWDATGQPRAPAHAQTTISAGFETFAEFGPSSFPPGRPDPRVVNRFGVAFTPDSRHFVTLDSNGWLALWETHPARLIEKLPDLGSNHWSVALSPDGHWLATGDCAGTLTIWDWTARRAVTNFTLAFEWFGWLRFSDSGHFLFATVMNNDWVLSTRIWRTAGWKEVPLTGSQLASLWSVDLSPDERFLAAGYADGKVKLYGHPSGKLEAEFTGHTGPVPGVLFWANGRALASASFDGSARLWDLAARRELADPLRGHAGMAASGALSPDGRRFATGGETPTDAVKLWDLVAHRELLTLCGEGQYFLNVAFSPDGNTLTATCLSGIAHFWHAPSWTEIEAAERRAAPQPDGTATADEPRGLRNPEPESVHGQPPKPSQAPNQNHNKQRKGTLPAHPESLASTRWLEEHLSDPSLRIVDARYPQSDAAFESGHIPGAAKVDPLTDLADPAQRPLLLVPSVGQFEALMSRLGIGNRTTVVVYDTAGGLWCARLWWALRYYGHLDVKLLEGGWRKWQLERRPIETQVTLPTPSAFRARAQPELRATFADVQAAVGSNNIILLDALSTNQHLGKLADMPSLPAGHIPSAKNVPAPSNLDPTNGVLRLPLEKLAALYAEAGVTPDKRIITYCGGGYYGAFSLFVLYQLGYDDVRLYDGSWLEWVFRGGKIETGP